MRALFAVLVLFLTVSIQAQNTGKKKNSRPASSADQEKTVIPEAGPPVYFYDFEKPEFLVPKVHIEHDGNGIGSITFEKKNLAESFTRDLVLSSSTMEKLSALWNELRFLTSVEDYQSHRDYSHLGRMKLKMAEGGKVRTVEFNWTENQSAKALTDEYKKIGYEYVWKFDIEVARKNQPLEAPRVMKQIDSYVRRGQISDPLHIVPFLIELSGDERMPLIARNHAKRLADSIEKKKNED
ncbi:MAG: hypothetical protein OEM82_03495 [Acidobacteriota bacterium]|nr:hypothetical protein [Acidobacteriota bacterium]